MGWVVYFFSIISVTPLFAAQKPNSCPAAVMAAVERNASRAKVQNNPLLQNSSLEHGAFPFDRLRNRDFPSALIQGLRLSQQRVDAIRKDSNPPTFQNTIEALAAVSEPLDQASSIFGHSRGLTKTPRLEAWGERLAPIFSNFSNAIFTDPTLFARVESLHLKRESLGLTSEQTLLLKHTYRDFVRSGAKLAAVEKARVVEIDSQLSKLNVKYNKNVSDSTNAYLMVIKDLAELAGLPQSARQAAAEEAKRRKIEGAWAFTLHAPSVMPFLTHAENRARREEFWKAYQSRANSGASDNRPLLLEIAKLKSEKAKLLGYATFSHFKMEDRMAKNPGNVERFLNDLASVYRPHAENDVTEVQALAPFPLQPWDFGFYSEKLKEQRYSYQAEEVRPYFRIDRVVQGAFYAAQRLYGVKFIPKPNLPTWDPSVLAYEVRDSKGQFLALFYFDAFPRESKRQGAWMNDIQGGGVFAGQMRRPHVLNAGNLTPPVGGEQALLTLDEVRTVFHELGHGLHSMLSQVKTASLFGTNVTWDFVELPSQFFENWALESEVLDVYARHKDTNERIPDALIEKVRRAENFQAGFRGLRQVMLAKLDMAWHSHDLASLDLGSIDQWEARITEPYRVLPRVNGYLTSATFSHIFAGGYSSGYYSYKWSEVLAADAFEPFKQRGAFDPEFAGRFLHEILEKGGTDEEATLYHRFRGQDPDPKALPRSEGLIE